MREPKRRGRIPGLHPQMGRRYNHVDLTQKRRSVRSRRAAQLLRNGLDAVEAAYTSQMDAELMHALHDAVVRLLRPEIKTEWTDDEARRRALQIAQELMEAPLPEHDR
jgi:hypothetical protein